jgi:hypothetical protein
MLDGNRYYAVFPDENLEVRLQMRSLFDLVKKLEKELRPHIEQFRVETTRHDRDKKHARSPSSSSL